MSRFRHSLHAGLMFLLTIVALVAQVDAEDVLPIDLVGDNVAACLEVPRFEATWTRLQRSQMLARLKRFGPMERLLSGPGFKRWLMVEEHVRATTGKTLSDQLLGAISESVIIAVYLPDGSRPQGVAISQARDEASLKRAIDSWSKLEPNRELRTLQHAGYAYFQRAKSKGSAEIVYYTSFGRTFALSDQESRIQNVIEHYVARNDTGSRKTLRESSIYLSNRSRLPQDSAAYLYLNAKPWNATFEDAIRQSADGVVARTVFQSLSAIGVSLRLDDEVVVDAVADLNPGTVPSGLRQFAAGTNGGLGWIQRIPGDAILLVSGRMDVRPLVQLWIASIPEFERAEFTRGRAVLNSLVLGRDFFGDVLPALLRDWTIALVAKNGSTDAVAPIAISARFRLEDEVNRSRETGSMVDSLDHALRFGATFAGALLSHQRGDASRPAFVKTITTDIETIRTLVGLPIWSPSFSVTANLLVIATDRSALSLRPSTASAAIPARLAACERRYFPEMSQLIWLDAVQMRELIARNGDWLAMQLAPDSPPERHRIQKHLAGVGEVLKLLDAAFVAAKFDEDRIRVVFGAALDRVDKEGDSTLDQ